MKKLLIIIVSIVSFSFVKAQTQFGVKAGINISTITGDNSNLFASKIATHAGGMARIPLASKFSLQPELMLSFEGAKFNTGGVSGSMNGTFVNMPVLGQYQAGSGFVIQSGPQLGLLMSATQKITGQGSKSIKDQLKSTNFSWVFGSSYTPKGSKVGFDIRYNLGLSNINAGNGNSNRTSVWQIGTFIILTK